MNSKGHLYISIIKSAIRIISCTLSISYSNWIFLAIGLGIAETLGIFEELVDKR